MQMIVGESCAESAYTEQDHDDGALSNHARFCKEGQGEKQRKLWDGGGGRSYPSSSMGTLFVVLVVIAVLSTLASLLARCCNGRHRGGTLDYDFEGWVEKKCAICIDGSVSVAPSIAAHASSYAFPSASLLTQNQPSFLTAQANSSATPYQPHPNGQQHAAPMSTPISVPSAPQQQPSIHPPQGSIGFETPHVRLETGNAQIAAAPISVHNPAVSSIGANSPGVVAGSSGGGVAIRKKKKRKSGRTAQGAATVVTAAGGGVCCSNYILHL
ncbi:hypothetical protein KP509_36G007600 [Ceratopteris richardii]|uniref:Uncharacterized protein n=1 Tax=Ceratopteris richardii TaxID=49495 RepID=A0A8T2QAJ8_CERRI|nr:hypothetical protein KP509_36G007600 [Ceratopteris richardii]